MPEEGMRRRGSGGQGILFSIIKECRHGEEKGGDLSESALDDSVAYTVHLTPVFETDDGRYYKRRYIFFSFKYIKQTVVYNAETVILSRLTAVFPQHFMNPSIPTALDCIMLPLLPPFYETLTEFCL